MNRWDRMRSVGLHIGVTYDSEGSNTPYFTDLRDSRSYQVSAVEGVQSFFCVALEADRWNVWFKVSNGIVVALEDKGTVFKAIPQLNNTVRLDSQKSRTRGPLRSRE